MYWQVSSLVKWNDESWIDRIMVQANSIFDAMDKAAESWVRIMCRRFGQRHHKLYAKIYTKGIYSVGLVYNEDLFWNPNKKTEKCLLDNCKEGE